MFFNYFRYSVQHQNDILYQYQDTLNEIELLKDPESELYKATNLKLLFYNSNNYNNQDDTGYVFTKECNETAGYTIKKNKDNFIYLQFNEALKFKKVDNSYAHFNLTRSKINFTIEYISKDNTESHIQIGG